MNALAKIISRKQSLLCAAALLLTTVALFGAVWPSSAYADARKTDIVLGQNIEARGLSASQCPSIESEYAILVDDEGRVLFERNASEAAKIASMTKIMTAVVAIENGELADVVTVDKEAATVGESSASLREGDSMTLESALSALMVPSGNDAAIAIAKAVGAKMNPDSADPQAVFVDAMNAKAQELGCRDTYFMNPHGLDIDRFSGDLHSTASDVALIVRYAMSNETFSKVVGQGDTVITVTGSGGTSRDITLVSTDELMGVYDGICGVKTGYTEDAGYCFAGAVKRDAGTFYTVVMNAPSSEQRFVDTQTLMDWGYDHMVSYPLAHSSQTVSMLTTAGAVDVPLVATIPHGDWVDVSIPATLSDPTAFVPVFDLSGNITQTLYANDVHGDIHAGDVIGSITYQQRGTTVAVEDIVATQDVTAPGFWDGVKVWWQRFIGGFTGKAPVAEAQLINESPLLLDKTA